MVDSRRQLATPKDLSTGLILGRGTGSIGGSEKAEYGEAWMRICLRLRVELGEEVFSSWLRCLELEGVSDGHAQLSVPTKFLQSWIRSHYGDRILFTLAAEFPAVKRISIDVRSSTRPAIARAAAGNADLRPCSVMDTARERTAIPVAAISPAGSPQSAILHSKRSALSSRDEEGLAGSPLDRRLTFANFLVGSSNQLAHAAAQRVAFAPAGEPLHYNPLYFHASANRNCFQGKAAGDRYLCDRRYPIPPGQVDPARVLSYA
jgi:chromosomal replication initiator protein